MATTVTSIAATAEGHVASTRKATSKDSQDRRSSKGNSVRPNAASLKYLHVAAVHSQMRASALSRDAEATPDYLGFRNLMVLVLVVMNLRLVMENFMKYGVLICIRCHDYSKQDLILSTLLYAMVPCHLYAAYAIELAAGRQAKEAIARAKRLDQKPHQIPAIAKKFQATWKIIAFAHGVNATLALLVTTLTVYNYIHHPLLGTISQIHAIIVWLKICSYAFTNRDLRYTLLNPEAAASLPELYSHCPYPLNISISNLSYFWWAPTLVYQPVYPRTKIIRWSYVAKRIAECFSLSIFIWLASAQYAAPLLHNSLSKISSLDLASVAERLMKLSTISLIVWLAGFFAVFHSALNALAEIMRFGDRQFYADWWNSPSVGVYWRTWNKPVYHFMRRHIYGPLVARGWSSNTASMCVFVFSGFLHELLVGVPTHNIIGGLSRRTKVPWEHR
ncbi:uncharacterized protein KY384_003094 [Bacidia gigantensis]|uniref:uncharacterized protein n=1 Tax=Bacidia gigantensis TaxID=2732470 RepID=UPI001D045B26|nr:uncharacterized protein KY384_003094 [Bacidia gigantensis]KAG8531465.1 hypothetical protein KY384_003094 [Bacidia gigantensis]